MTTLSLVFGMRLYAAPSGPAPAAQPVEQARQAFHKGDTAQVIEIAHQALTHGENAELRDLLGKAYARSGQRQQAAIELSTAIRLQPDNEEFRFDLGQFLLRVGDFQTAAVVLEEAHQRLPRSAQIELALGVAYYCTVRYDEAVAAFLRTMEMAPDVPQPYVFLGKVLVHADTHLPEIIRDCVLTERSHPTNPYAPLLHAQAVIAQLGPIADENKVAIAVKLLEKSIALRSDSGAAYFVFGSLMDRQGNRARAVQLLEKCVQLEPGNAIARYRLGQLYARLGKREQAAAQFAEQAKLKQQAHQRRQ